MPVAAAILSRKASPRCVPIKSLSTNSTDAAPSLKAQGPNEQPVAFIDAFGEPGAQRVAAQLHGLGRRDVFLGIAGPDRLGIAGACQQNYQRYGDEHSHSIVSLGHNNYGWT